MNIARKIMGGLLLLPTPWMLIAFAWLGGIAHILTQPENLELMSRTVTRTLPSFADRSANLIRTAKTLKSQNAQAWLDALDKAQLSPSILLTETGMLGWLRQEGSHLSDIFRKIAQGESRPQDISLDLHRLKLALGSPRFDDLLKRMFSQFPACTVGQLSEWQAFQVTTRVPKSFPPPCRPSELVMPSLMRSKKLAVIHMPSHVPLVPYALTKTDTALIQQLLALPWLIFLLPALLILLGAAIGGKGMRGFCQWAGVTTLLGGLLALPTPFLLKDVLLKTLFLETWNANVQPHLPIPQPTFHHWLFEQTLPFLRDLTNPLFRSVETVGVAICVIGFGLIALSFGFPSKQK